MSREKKKSNKFDKDMDEKIFLYFIVEGKTEEEYFKKLKKSEIVKIKIYIKDSSITLKSRDIKTHLKTHIKKIIKKYPIKQQNIYFITDIDFDKQKYDNWKKAKSDFNVCVSNPTFEIFLLSHWLDFGDFNKNLKSKKQIEDYCENKTNCKKAYNNFFKNITSEEIESGIEALQMNKKYLEYNDNRNESSKFSTVFYLIDKLIK